ncbi:hypothetical protein [Pseudomonas haemolytica]|uniref:Uncharacterized protein n=1 Tax=Pseudomonas haemolytica TaxID=2600065 RepID=A0ABS1GQ60_9PSED|nr:hypothetical protein [Pseudomonas haemolytica]MBK3459123.1 hypothetical protein [Pseudomonas haemolytica]
MTRPALQRLHHGPHAPQFQPQLDHQVLHHKSLKRFGVDESRRVAANAFELMEHAAYQTGSMA